VPLVVAFVLTKSTGFQLPSTCPEPELGPDKICDSKKAYEFVVGKTTGALVVPSKYPQAKMGAIPSFWSR
jgi:hypothetical protein